ncbi:MAG TPA: hypothetical protein VJ917_12885 [Saprospiraceae bacterium]|nr:hypothetical protein [Saprospiraceae bacterium]
MRKLFGSVLFGFVFLMACGNSSPNERNNEAEQEKPNVEEAQSVDDQHACDLLDVNKIADILGLDANQIESLREDFSNMQTCMMSSTELSEEGDKVDFLNLTITEDDDGSFDFENAIKYQLDNKTIRVPAGPDKGKDVPLKSVEGLRGYGAMHSAAHYSVLNFNEGKSKRYSLTLYRKIPGNFVFDGIEGDSEELETYLVEIAKTL